MIKVKELTQETYWKKKGLTQETYWKKKERSWKFRPYSLICPQHEIKHGQQSITLLWCCLWLHTVLLPCSLQRIFLPWFPFIQRGMEKNKNKQINKQTKHKRKCFKIWFKSWKNLKFSTKFVCWYSCHSVVIWSCGMMNYQNKKFQKPFFSNTVLREENKMAHGGRRRSCKICLIWHHKKSPLFCFVTKFMNKAKIFCFIYNTARYNNFTGNY